MNALPTDGRNTVTSSLLAACTLGFLVSPFLYLALGALESFAPILFVVALPPLFASIAYLGRRYLRKVAPEPGKLRHTFLEAACWLVVIAFLAVISGFALLTPFERLGFFFCIDLPASAVCLLLVFRRPMALKMRFARLPAWIAISALALFGSLAAIVLMTYALLPTRFPGG